MSTLPLLGAALTLRSVEQHRDWLFEQDRDLELQEFHQASVLDGDWRSVVDACKRVLDGYHGRMSIHGPFWGFSMDSRDPLVRAVVTKRYLQGLDVCEALGATQMVIHSPFTTWSYNNLDMTAKARGEMLGFCHQTLESVVKRAEQIGCELVIENIEDINPLDRLILAQSFDSEAVRVSIDTGHAHYAHGTNGAPPVDYYVMLAGEALKHVHLQDADGYADRHWQPGDGTVNWRAVFTALATLGSNPRLVLEVRDQTQLMRGVRYLTNLGVAR
jgi:sugar phosphate isomerase/epimerase